MAMGDRLRSARKRRGMSQRELADASGVSLSLVRKLEQGEREDTRLETARLLAAALRVPTSTLLSDPDELGATQQMRDMWAPVRTALDTPPSRVLADEEPTLAGVASALDATSPLFAGDRFAELAVALPPLIRDADVLAETDTAAARAIRVRLLQLTGWLMVQTRQFDAAEDALERALAEGTDRLQGASTVNTICWLHLRRGHLTEARELATRWADDVEPRLSRATPAELSAWGWLLLRVSAAAVRDNRPSEAEDALRLAHSAAVALGVEYAPREDFLRTFGPTTVGLKRCENAAISGRPDQVLALAERVPHSQLRPTSNNANRHRLDVAKAHVELRQYTEAVDVLERVRRRSPQWLPNQRLARDIVSGLIEKRRSPTPEMRRLADAVALPI